MHHPTPLSRGARKALAKALLKSRAVAGILADRPAGKRRVGEALIREADNLACQLWNERCGVTAGQSIRRLSSFRRRSSAASARRAAFVVCGSYAYGGGSFPLSF
jgi:hypothetical protein